MNRYFWLAFLPIHIFFALAFFNSTSISWTLIIILWILLSGYGVGVTLHRLLSHKSFTTYKPLYNVLSFLSCFCVQGSPLFWVNIHRGYHHKHSDQQEDIHSPIHGKWWAYFLWSCKVDPKKLSYKFVPDLLRSKFHIWMSQYYFYIVWAGWLISFLISPTLFFSLVIAQIITMHLEFIVNLFCHTRGVPGSYRNFDTKDNSQNYWLFGLTCWGIGYHNNHHHKPNDYNFGHTRNEFDPTTLLVRLIKKNV